MNPEEHSLEFLVGLGQSVLQMLTLFETKICKLFSIPYGIFQTLFLKSTIVFRPNF